MQLTILKGVAALLITTGGNLEGLTTFNNKCDALYIAPTPGPGCGSLTLNLVCNASTCDAPPNYPWPATLVLTPKGAADCS
jgi:hypothetical protein